MNEARGNPLKAWLPPSCSQRLVLLVGLIPDAPVDSVLSEFPRGTTGSQVRQALREQVPRFPGRLLAVEHQGWWHDDSWIRYLWGGAVPPLPERVSTLPPKPPKVKKPRKSKGRKRL
jgi:hypothetical protein